MPSSRPRRSQPCQSPTRSKISNQWEESNDIQSAGSKHTWPNFSPLLVAHDVGRSRDRSTAVIGGNCPAGPRLLGIKELEELPKGLYGSARASALAAIDRRYNHNAIIIADLSNDAT